MVPEFFFKNFSKNYDGLLIHVEKYAQAKEIYFLSQKEQGKKQSEKKWAREKEA